MLPKIVSADFSRTSKSKVLDFLVVLSSPAPQFQDIAPTGFTTTCSALSICLLGWLFVILYIFCTSFVLLLCWLTIIFFFLPSFQSFLKSAFHSVLPKVVSAVRVTTSLVCHSNSLYLLMLCSPCSGWSCYEFCTPTKRYRLSVSTVPATSPFSFEDFLQLSTFFSFFPSMSHKSTKLILTSTFPYSNMLTILFAATVNILQVSLSNF